jgi:radical SAM protein with 4Fe4S-binding SPASM domain
MTRPKWTRWVAGRRLWPLKRPLYVSMAVSERCNLACMGCRAWRRSASGQDMDPAVFKSIVRNLDGLQPLALDLIGAEPTLNPHLTEMVAYATGRGFSTRLFSNGSLLNPKRSSELVQAGLSKVTLSLDAADGRVHDRLRGQKGCFRAVLNAIDGLASAFAPETGRISLAMLVSGRNYRQVPAVLALSRKLGDLDCSMHWISLVPARLAAAHEASLQFAAENGEFHLPADRLSDLRSVLASTRSRKGPNSLRLLRVLPDETFTDGRFPVGHCRYVDVSLNIDVRGNAYPCSHYHKPLFGDLTAQPWAQVWTHPERRAFTNMLKQKVRPVCAYCCHHMHNLSIPQMVKTLAGIPLTAKALVRRPAGWEQ